MRYLLAEEINELAELEASLFPDNCFNEYTLRRELQISRCLVESKGGKLIGYALVRIDEGLVDILRLGVQPGYHRQGVASRLLVRVLGEAPVALLTVKKDNLPALSLYVNFGFRIVAQLEREKAWLMLRDDG